MKLSNSSDAGDTSVLIGYKLPPYNIQPHSVGFKVLVDNIFQWLKLGSEPYTHGFMMSSGVGNLVLYKTSMYITYNDGFYIRHQIAW